MTIHRWQLVPVATPASLRIAVCMAASIAAGLALGGLVFLLMGIPPVTAMLKMATGSFGSWYGFKETVTKAVPLTLIGAGLALCFRARVWNIGAEGQLLFGAVAATCVGLHLGPTLAGWPGIVLMFAAGAVAGGAWAAVPALMRIRWGVNEAVSSLLLNYVAAEFVQYLIYGPLKGKTQFGFPYSDDLPNALWLPTFYGSRLSWFPLVLAAAAVVVLTLISSRTRFGYDVRVVGENPAAAAYAGIPFGRTILSLMVLSGILAGIAGSSEIAGLHHHLTYPWSISSGYGFTAILTAFLARLHPGWTWLSALLFGGLLVGGDIIQTSLGLPFATVNIFNGLVLVAILAGEYLISHRLVRRSAEGGPR
ncbi:MAG TPA: ABC transporter permease [Candidatus Ozemobacteraceae bacterium]|nr:ABC transporter permease [Candidatus Ozemobacteraceae bacterium]